MTTPTLAWQDVYTQSRTIAKDPAQHWQMRFVGRCCAALASLPVARDLFYDLSKPARVGLVSAFMGVAALSVAPYKGFTVAEKIALLSGMDFCATRSNGDRPPQPTLCHLPKVVTGRRQESLADLG